MFDSVCTMCTGKVDLSHHKKSSSKQIIKLALQFQNALYDNFSAVRTEHALQSLEIVLTQNCKHTYLKNIMLDMLLKSCDKVINCCYMLRCL